MNTEERLEKEFKELIKEINDEVVKNTVMSEIKLIQKNISNNSREIKDLTDQLKKETIRITSVRKNIQKDIIKSVEISKQEVKKSADKINDISEQYNKFEKEFTNFKKDIKINQKNKEDELFSYIEELIENLKRENDKSKKRFNILLLFNLFILSLIFLLSLYPDFFLFLLGA
jgi:protein subunit release factor A